jgi:hypothetical protein
LSSLFQAISTLTSCRQNLRDEVAMDVDEEEEEGGDSTQRIKRVPDYGIEVDFEILSANEREVSDVALSTTYCAVFLCGRPGATQNPSSEVLGEFDASITKLNAEIERMTPNMKAMDRHVFLTSLTLASMLTTLCLGLMMSRSSSQRQKRRLRKPVKILKTQEIRSTM